MVRFVALLALLIQAGGPSNLDAARGKTMLRELRSTLEKHYYDPTFGGRNLDAYFAPAEKRLEAAKSTSDILSALAIPLLDLEDSHTFFVPPARSVRTEYGWEMSVVGNGVFVTAVAPGSDAEGKGLKAGDRVLVVNNQTPSRENLWKLNYLFNGLRPQPALVVKIQRPDGSIHDLTLRARTTQRVRTLDLTSNAGWQDEITDYENRLVEMRNAEVELGETALVWKMPTFVQDPDAVARVAGRARRFKTLILDLRGNGGGYVVSLERLAAHLLGPDKSLGFAVTRKGRTERFTKSVRELFTGELIVLVDSRSASAAEELAGLIKHYKRGTLLGDRTAGAVMESIVVPHRMGAERIITYAMSVTVADALLPDGSRLEKVGVVPDVVVLPSPADLAAGRDPVLARAAELAGVALTPEAAGKLFPREWRK